MEKYYYITLYSWFSSSKLLYNYSSGQAQGFEVAEKTGL